MGVAEDLGSVIERMTHAARASGRDPAEITLLAVSKRKPAEKIREAYAAGQRDFAENYAQELRDKAALLVDLPGIRWHAIGPLQRNKAKYVAACASSFHAIDRAEIAIELGKRRIDDPIDGFIEVNLAGEASKAGVSPEEAERLYAEIARVPGLRVVGLMAMPPQEEPEQSRPYFRALRELAARLGLPKLSMGTTEDLEVAIEEGATHVRVGRAIFGERSR